MSLVDYSNSDDDVEHSSRSKTDSPGKSAADNAVLKRKRQEQGDEPAQRVTRPAPCLPADFHALYATQVRSSTTDDPSLHGGRQRQVPHVIGNWPSFVYLQWLPSEVDLLILDRVIEEASKQLGAGSVSEIASSKVQSSLRSDLGVHLPLHISMSSPLTLTTDTKDAFEPQLRHAVRTANIPAFEVSAVSVRWVSNFEKTRHFLIMSLTKPEHNQLRKLLSTCNNVARSFGLPELYANKESSAVGVKQQPPTQLEDREVVVTSKADDKVHISIAWTLAKPDSNICILGSELHQKLTSIKMCFEDVLIKVGNIVSTVRLQERTATTSLLAP